MSTVIFLEGGAVGQADSREVNIRCREGFRKLLESCGFAQGRRMPKLVACGGRDSVLDDFSIGHAGSSAGDYIAMWIDSEEPMGDIKLAWKHLQNVTTVPKWMKPDGATDDQVLFMTTCMETWIIADRATLKTHFGNKVQDSALVPLHNLEGRGRHAIQDALVHATRGCSNAYMKGKKSFEVLGKLDPETLAKHLPSFVRLLGLLNKNL